MKKKVELDVQPVVDEYHGVGGEYVINGEGKRVPLRVADASQKPDLMDEKKE